MANFEYVDVNGRQIRVRPRETAQEIDEYGNFHRQPNRFTEGFGEGKNPVEKDRYILSTKVKKHFLEQWEKDPDIVFEAALVNTYFISPPRIYHWEKMLFDKEYRGDNFMDILGSYHPNKGISGNCLSTEKRTNGAAAIFLPGVARRLAELLESDLYLVFTSIHEVMVHSTDKVYPEELKEVLLDTVKKATPEEDYLTSSIYRYSRRTGEFSVEVK